MEAAFKDLKDDLSLRPIFHKWERRIEAHIFVAFLAYCLHVHLRARLEALANLLQLFAFKIPDPVYCIVWAHPYSAPV